MTIIETGYTDAEAVDLFSCPECKKGKDCREWAHGTWCVESATGSMRCIKCDGRIWKQGSIGPDDKVLCPYCGQLNQRSQRG